MQLQFVRLAAAIVALWVSSPATAQDAVKALFSYVGPLKALLPEGKTPALVTSGLRFTVTITDAGKSVSTGSFDLNVPGADKPLHLDLDGLKFDAGHLTASSKLTNGTGAPLEGLRLDIVGASETYMAKDDAGAPVLKSRGQPAHLDSPLYFGDIKSGDDNGELALNVTGIAFAPETTQIAVTGVVSGMRFEGLRLFPMTGGGGAIATDSQGRIYMTSTAVDGVVRVDNNGGNPTTIAKLPDQCTRVSVSRKTGEIAAICINHPKVFLFTPGGDDKDPIAEAQGLTENPGCLRYDPNGALWGSVSGIWKFGPDHKPVSKIEKAGDFDIESGAQFDVTADGTVFLLTSESLFRISPDGKTAKRIANGPGTKPTQLMHPAAVRVAPNGNIYVLESKDSDTESAPRISVFDATGNLVRMFGRGGKSPAPGYPETMLTGELNDPEDLEIGTDGRVYVSMVDSSNTGAAMVFAPL